MYTKDRNAKAPHGEDDSEPLPASFHPSTEELERALSLFCEEGDHFLPDLELPIKMETRKFSRRRARRQSDSFSEPPVELQKEEEKAFAAQHHMEIEEMMPAGRNYDTIEELMMPLEPPEAAKSQVELQPAEQQLPEMPLEEESLEDELKKISGGMAVDHAGDRALHRNALLRATNNFKAFSQGLAIAMNYHSLLHKDCVTKIFGSILTVVHKESRKMEMALIEELKATSALLRQEEAAREQRKELFKTMAGDDKFMVKEEYIE